jgi:hypothetical protein
VAAVGIDVAIVEALVASTAFLSHPTRARVILLTRSHQFPP